MSLRDDLQPVIDDARTLIGTLGLRARTVKTRSRAWSGASIGLGTATDTDVTLSPTPKVREPPARLVFDSPGKYESGDLIARRITRAYTEAQLTGGTLAAKTEWFWLVDDRLYRVVGAPEKRNFEWVVQLRRVTAR